MDWLTPIREFSELALPFLDRLFFIRALLVFVLVFFLPGFAWTLVFFRQINIIERIALSFGLSIAVVTLSILSLNKAGVMITGFNSVLIIIIVTIVPLVFYYLKRLIGSRSPGEGQ